MRTYQVKVKNKVIDTFQAPYMKIAVNTFVRKCREANEFVKDDYIFSDSPLAIVKTDKNDYIIESI